MLGKLGCFICLLGSLVIVLHAPADKEVETVDEILKYALRPGFLVYCSCVAVFALFMIFGISPKYGRKIPMVYVSICSTVGSVSVMAIKGFGIALKLTLQGNNQFTHLSTYVFSIVVVLCIGLQLNYFNKALDQFDISIVNPLYYVTFTTFTLLASFILFAGVNTPSIVDILTLFCGFLTIFAGVYILSLSRGDPRRLMKRTLDSLPMSSAIAGTQTRQSFQGQRTLSKRNSSSRNQTIRLTPTRDVESLGLNRDDIDADESFEPYLDSDSESSIDRIFPHPDGRSMQGSDPWSSVRRII